MSAGTVCGPGAVGLDVDAVSAWLVGLGATSPLGVCRLGHGHSNLTFLFTDATGRGWVLRRPPLGKLAGFKPFAVDDLDDSFTEGLPPSRTFRYRLRARSPAERVPARG